MKEHIIHFLPDEISVSIEEGQTILEAAQKCGIAIISSCGGVGNCDKCLVMPSGSDVPVRACQYIPDCDMSVTIPDTSRHSAMKVMSHGFNLNCSQKVLPELRQLRLKLTAPELSDLRSDAQRIIDAVDDILDMAGGESTLTNDLLKQLPTILRNGIYDSRDKENAIVIINSKNEVIGLKPVEPGSRIYGLGIDFGTTTIVAALADLETGEVLGRSSMGNPQSAHGDDVISRINYTCEHNNGLEILNGLAIKAINDLAGELAKNYQIDLADIYEVTVVGNATMQHILADVPVGQIGQAPYVAAFNDAVKLNASLAGLNINPGGYMMIAPAVAGHIGGDTIAVVLAAEMEYDTGVSLAVDIGTNGEIVLAHDGQIYCCSTAAGPAFEGAKIQYGMRAANGAIEKFSFENGKVELGIIGDCKAKGICGSGLVDIISCLLENGLVDETGRMPTGEELSEEVPAELAGRVTEYNNQPAFLLVPESESSCGSDIVLTQRDIRETQLGKAAIAAGIETLLANAGLKMEDVDRVYMAGAFGNYLHPASALRVGLFPAVAVEKIVSIGNAAGMGAVMMLTNKTLRHYAGDLAELMEYVELAGRAEFQMLYADKMMF